MINKDAIKENIYLEYVLTDTIVSPIAFAETEEEEEEGPTL